MSSVTARIYSVLLALMLVVSALNSRILAATAVPQRVDKVEADTIRSVFQDDLAAVSAVDRFSANPAAHSRVIVKLRSELAESLVQAESTLSGSGKMSGANTANPEFRALLGKHAVRTATPLHVAHVRSRAKQGRSEAQLMTAVRQRFPVRAARVSAAAVPLDLGAVYIFDLSDRSAAEMAETVRSLRADANVAYVEEDKVVRTRFVPNDPSYAATGSWGQSYDDLYGLKNIGVAEAWDTTQGQGVVVAVIDTGIDYNHPDIADNVWINPGEIPGNGIDDDNNGYVDDVRGWDFVGPDNKHPVEDSDPDDGNFHGTHVAGTIAATGNNSLGVIGVAWNAKVMAVKGLSDSGEGNDSDMARAIIYAADNGADVINASWGGEGGSQTVSDAIAYAHALGVVLIAAAGNDHLDVKSFYPASDPRSIVVSALDPYDGLAHFSNYGSKVDIAAPGMDIYSLQAGTGGYARHDGTSMAAPHVSGVTALIIAQHPEYTAEHIRQVLRVSAADLGEPGRDISFGYGRVNAAQAVLVDRVVGAKILAPMDGTVLSAPAAVTGIVEGADLDHYEVEIGAGADPSVWVALGSAATEVFGAKIGQVDTAAFADGLYTIRLRASSKAGVVFSDRIQVEVRYLQISSPAKPAVPALTKVVKPGTALSVEGWATGPSFQSYQLEWAQGSAATSGWSTSGVSLAGGGKTAVAGGLLGEWIPPVTLDGYYTLMLTVTNSGFSSKTTTVVYVEPALLSEAWPKFSTNIKYWSSALPALQPDGTTRLILGGKGGLSTLYAYALDGSSDTLTLNGGADQQPCIANLDGQPGDEIVVADAYDLKIVSSRLQLIRTIRAGQNTIFGYDPLSIADLDSDGIPEILISARDSSQPGFYPNGAFYVYRTDGTLFSKQFPRPIASCGLHTGEGIMHVATDLNGDGMKEIVIAFENPDEASYTVEAINANGTPYAGWQSLSFSNRLLFSLAAADLDHNGTSELIITEYNKTEQTKQVLVLESAGVVRAGWPVTVERGGTTNLAIGDLDRDHRLEIVVANPGTLTVLRDDGTAWSPATPLFNGGYSADYNTSSTPLIADIDGDGWPEIIDSTGTTVFDGSPDPKRYLSLTVYNRDGSVRQSWPLFGTEGRQPSSASPLVGDFNGDGLTDIAVQVALVEGGGINGVLANSSLTVLTTGTTYNANASGWTSYNQDPRNSRVTDLVVPPRIITQPIGQMKSIGGTATFTMAASGLPAPTCQWQKDGVILAGATGVSLTVAPIRSADFGRYAALVKNAAGESFSLSAMLIEAPDTIGGIPPGFDILGYLTRYPDVATVVENNYYAAWLYYRNQGIYVGEVFDDLFRVEEYLTLYPELFAIFGNDLGAALDHWLSTGRIEGKLGRIPLEFSADGYFTRNPDVATAVNNDPLLAWGHYWLYGIYEGRAYDEELRVFEYLAINADLTAAFVNDCRQAALHWMRYGRTEGRLGRLPLTFSVAEYLNRSPDVAAVWGTNPTTVFLHFWLYGIDENRTYDDLFRPSEYLDLNPDLAAVLGTDRRLAFKHWVRYGMSEGRPGKNP